MSVREPAKPHVMALHYRVARNDDVIYRSTQRSVHQRGGFDVVMDGGEVTLELHGHYVDESSARAAVRDYIEEWEFQADLTIGTGKLRLEFIRAEIVDRDPVFGDRHLPSWVTLASIRPSAIPAPVDYPNPPLGVTVDFDDKLFAAMRQRYDVYPRDPQTLTAVAYFCLTCLEKTVLPKKGPNAVAILYGIPYRDLERVSDLTDRKGGYQGASKAKAIDSELTEEERDFLADMVRLMIRKRGEAVAKDSVEGAPDAG